jgi:hypothetical protein
VWLYSFYRLPASGLLALLVHRIWNDDGDNNETCCSGFNVNFDTVLKQQFCASVGNKTFILTDWFS